MKITIKATNIKLSPPIESFVEEKMSSLEKYLRNIKLEPLEAFIEIEKTTVHHRKGDVFRAEAQFHLPGQSIRAESIRDDLHLAIDEVRDELQRKFKQYTQKQISKRRRGARALKKLFHLSLAARFFRKGRIRDEGA
ncbi:MAG: ribosome-associated translation inhibitor RaiA [Candidatus Aenigmarchaeota archaeon]|nr:ribosome-associated translation inhibitor RaiA [Candidatus Aenigmarchaeota archaeon]